jgi:gliding motility-associated-like protein
MGRRLKGAVLLLTVLFFGFRVAAQPTYTTSLNGTVYNLPCGTTCLNLKVRVPHLKSSDEYQVVSIPYTPFDYRTSAPALSSACASQDDKFFDTTILPFTFCFYGANYSRLAISSNGLISFDSTNALRGSNYQLRTTTTIPFTNEATATQGTGSCPTPSLALFPRAAIMGVYHDIEPVTNSGHKIEARVEGNAPFRRFVVSFDSVRMFFCNTLRAKSQIVIYESTGLIDIYIGNKPLCTGSNGGLAILGIQNWNRDKALAAPGKNSTQWSESNTAYRFVPSGAPSRFQKAEIYDLSGTLLQTVTTDTATTTQGILDINFPTPICPTSVPQKYVVKTFFSACTGTDALISTDTITINKSGSLGATFTTTASSCAPNGSITVNIPAGNGAPPYSFVLDGGAPIAVNAQTYTLTGLTGGTHTVQITSGACTQNLDITVPSNSTLAVTTAVTNTTCNTTNNGTVTINAPNGTPPFQYSINNGTTWQASNVFNNLAPGNYTVAVKDNSGCQVNGIPVSIAQGPPLTVSFDALPPSCANAANGSVTITPLSGQAPYQYQMNPQPFQTATNVYTNLAPGVYTFSVKDNTGCALNNISITVPNGSGSLAATAAATPTSCTGVNNGTITITPASGSGPYQYSLNGGAYQPGLVANGLAPGAYSVTVKDNSGCVSAPINVTVGAGTGVQATAASTPAACSSVNNGTITVTASNGSAPYSYVLDGGIAQTSNVFTNVAAGNHLLTVKDSWGCAAPPINITVAVRTPITATTTAVATTCSGANDGSVTITAANGTMPYQYGISGSTFSANNTFNNLPAGSYTAIVKDSFGCSSDPFSFSIAAGPALSGTATATATSCNGAANGTITATATNGTGPFTYSLDGGAFQTSNVFSGVSAGNHTVVIRSAAGCSTSAIAVTVASGATIGGTAATVAASCSGVNNGSVTITPTNGGAPYTYALNGGAFQSSNTFTGLAAGSYTVVIKDVAGCVSPSIPFTISSGAGPTATFVTTPTSCGGANNGTITVNASGTTAPYQYSLNGGAFVAAATFTGLAAGNYSVVVRDALGCTSAALPVTVNPGQPLTATVATTPVLCNGGNNGGATVSLSNNGTPPYQYSLDGVSYQASNVFGGLGAGNYTVYFKDQNQCASTQAFSIGQPAVLALASAGKAVLCNGQANGQITSAVNGGTAPYQFRINGGAYQTSDVFNVAAGTYTVTVQDAAGCTATQTLTITEPAAISATAVTAVASCAGNDGKITLTASGGTSPYQYSSDGANYQSGNVLTVAPGNYTAFVKDANGCVFSLNNQVVGLTNTLTFTPMADTTICEGVSATLRPQSNATGYSWQTSASLSAANIQNPVASPKTDERFIVTLSLGICSASDTVNVFVRPAPVADAGANATICFGQDYTLQGSGGVSYQWSPATYLTSTNTATPTSVRPRENMQYALTVTDANGCRSLQPDVMQLSVTPPIKVTLNKDTVVAMNDTLRLFASSIATSYLWSPAFGLSDATVANPLATITGDISYTVVATTAAGCQGEARINIKVYDGPELYTPTAFTPNGDGRNDVFRPFPVGIKQLNYFRVYNREGQLLFSTTTLNRGWDGTYNGQPQVPATYVWVAEGVTKEGKVIAKKGTVVLIR